MPKLLLFSPCDKVIINRETNTATLVDVLERVEFVRPSDVQVPPKVMFPMKWDVLTCWEREPDDHGVEFSQRIGLISPDNQSLFENDATWHFETLLHRTIAHIYGFPFTTPGTCRLNLSLSRVGSQEWIDITSFPIEFSVRIASSP